jgi:dTDP-L-rhamnose 4-epimerase
MSVRVLNNLNPQIHGLPPKRPDYRIFHFAAAVGVGQSMYEVADYTSVNAGGTAILMEELSEHPVQKLVVAPSISIYGEGLYRFARYDSNVGTKPLPVKKPRVLRKFHQAFAQIHLRFVT